MVENANGDTKAGDTAPVIKPPRKKKSSAQGDFLFVSFLAVYGGLMKLSFDHQIPNQSWELMTVHDHFDWAKWMGRNLWIPLVLSVLYIAFCFIGQYYLKDKAGYDKELRLPLAAWSIFLAVFSVAGSLRCVPALTEIILTRGMIHAVCGDTRFEWIEGPAGFWTLVFCLSKIPELIDTAFIVLRKKELITLHWYHHFTVMLFCWQAWATCCLNGLIFAAMNLTVHAIMYTFYALTALGYRPTTFALFITLGQIIQMVVGTLVTGYVTMDKVLWNPVEKFDFSLTSPPWFISPIARPDGGECHVSSGSALSGLLMYGSYLGFFVEFFYGAYCKKGAKGE